MSRISDILIRVRDALGDTDKERWTDSQLLRHVSAGQRDLARHTRILHGSTTILVEPNVAVYPLPDDVLVITRVAFGNSYLKITSFDWMDRKYGDIPWTLETAAAPTHLVVDKRNLNEIRLFPIPNEDVALGQYPFTTPDPEFAGAEYYGVVTDIEDYTSTGFFGVVTALYDPTISKEVIDPFGVVTDIRDATSEIEVRYIKVPSSLQTIDDDLSLANVFDDALVYYATSEAFRSDVSAQNREASAAHFALYERELRTTLDISSSNSIQSDQVQPVQYLTPF